jgi:PAS domain S-box-containing protein
MRGRAAGQGYGKAPMATRRISEMGPRLRRSPASLRPFTPTPIPPPAVRPDSVASVSFQDLIERAPVAAFVKDAQGCYVYASPYLLAMMGKHMGPDWRGKSDADLWPPEAAAAMHTRDEAAMSGEGPQIFSRMMPRADGPHTVLMIEFPLPTLDGGIGVGGLAVDVTEFAGAQTDHAQRVAITDHTTDSVMVVGLDGLISDVNAAFERASQYSRLEAIGQNPRFLQSGLHTAEFYQQMWSSLTAGVTWTGELIDRRKDGSFYIEAAVIAPIVDGNGQPAGYVAVNHDVTAERAFMAGAAVAVSEHALALEVIRDLLPGAPPEATAQAICHKVATLPGLNAAQIIAFQLDGRAVPIGHAVAGRPDPPLLALSHNVGRRLRARAAHGPWIEPWANRQGRAYDQLVQKAGPSSMAYAPVRYGERLVGLLAVQSVDVANKNAIADLLPTLAEFADLTGAVLGLELTGRIEMQISREHVSGIIAKAAFSPVFQPIVDIVLNEVVGYEALTRFTDGSDPESVFAEAAAVHLGLELEIATLKAALAASSALPPQAWLNFNASPELILDGGRLRSLTSGIRRLLVVEVTEHQAVEDYPAFRAAVASLRRGTRLAVDDAGTGFASLRHILELRPAFVKLDRWLVSGLEDDEARQAMIVGLRHFARHTGCLLIAEGIETDRELAAVRSLDIRLGQGYALGRPSRAELLPVLVAAGG